MSGQRKRRLRDKANNKAYETRQANKSKEEMNRLRVALFRSQKSSSKSDDTSNLVRKSKSERTIRYLKQKAEAVLPESPVCKAKLVSKMIDSLVHS